MYMPTNTPIVLIVVISNIWEDEYTLVSLSQNTLYMHGMCYYLAHVCPYTVEYQVSALGA